MKLRPGQGGSGSRFGEVAQHPGIPSPRRRKQGQEELRSEAISGRRALASQPRATLCVRRWNTLFCTKFLGAFVAVVLLPLLLNSPVVHWTLDGELQYSGR